MPRGVRYGKEKNLDMKDWLGLVGGALTSLSLLPQIWQLFRLKSAHEISLPFSILMLAGLTCWLVYGIVFNLFPVILWNGIAIVLAAAMLYAKLKYGKN